MENSMNTKDLILQELAETPDSIMAEVLDFLRYLKSKEERETLEDEEDVAEALEILSTVEADGTVPWNRIKERLGLSS
jgi:hypothetical protein